MRVTGLDRLRPAERKATGIVCVHCQGKGVEPQHYDEKTGWSDARTPCATCQGAGRIYTVEQYLNTLPADWHSDNSLSTWFPLSAEALERLKRENERLTRLTTTIPVLVGIIERCASECAECEGAGCPECADLRSALALVSQDAAEAEE